MKEKELKRNLDYLIIDGLIKEAEQDDADFEAAMRRMSEEDFNELIHEPAFAYAADDCLVNFSIACGNKREMFEAIESADAYDSTNASEPAEKFVYPPHTAAPTSRRKKFRPWITAAITAAAVILIVLIPSINIMNNKLCDSALLASSSYIASSESASQIIGLDKVFLERRLPDIERKYEECSKNSERFYETLDDKKSGERITYHTADLREAGWDLALAYLKLHRKGDAEKVLKVLAEQYKGTPFGEHCQKMLNQL